MNIRDLGLENPIDYIAVYAAHKSFKRLCEIYKEEKISSFIFHDNNRFLQKVLSL